MTFGNNPKRKCATMERFARLDVKAVFRCGRFDAAAAVAAAVWVSVLSSQREAQNRLARVISLKKARNSETGSRVLLCIKKRNTRERKDTHSHTQACLTVALP